MQPIIKYILLYKNFFISLLVLLTGAHVFLNGVYNFYLLIWFSTFKLKPFINPEESG